MECDAAGRAELRRQTGSHLPLWATGAMVVGVFAIGSEALVVSPLLKDVSASFGVRDDRSGLAIAAYGLTLGLSTPLFGPVSDFVSRRLVMVMSLLFFSASAAACALAPTFSVLLAARGICGVAAGVFLPATYAFVGDRVAFEQRAKVMGLVMSGWAASLVLGVPLGAAIGQVAGWRGAFAAVAAMALISTLALVRLRERPQGPRLSEDGGILRKLTRALGENGVVPLMLVHFAAMTGFYGMYTYLGSFLRDQLRMGGGGAGAFVLIYGLGFTIATVNARIIDRVGKVRALLVALVGPVAVMLTLPHFGSSITLLAALLLVWGVLQGVGLTTTLTLAGGLSDTLRGRISALATCAGYLGMTFGSALMGSVFERDGYVAVGAACATAATCASAIFFWRFVARNDLYKS
jgi:MFS transporter, DHA1 family, inner membrane transport protein